MSCGRSGFTYIGMLVVIAIIGITTSVVGPTWKTAAKAEKERELLWRGHQIRQAIGRYYEAVEIPSHRAIGLKLYPKELKDLMLDPRSPGAHRYLRKIYKDPMTGEDDWVLILDERQRIKGVHSASDAKPLKRDNFDPGDETFRGKTRYSEWVFEYVPAAPAAPTPAPTPTPTPAPTS